MERLRRAILTRRVGPPQAIAIDEDYAAQNSPIIDPRPAVARGKEGLQPRHLLVGQPEKVAHRHPRKLGSLNHAGRTDSSRLMGPDPRLSAAAVGNDRLCCTNRLLTGPPLFPGQTYPATICEGCAEGGEAIWNGDTNLELRDLTVEVACGEALPQELAAVHLGLCTASAVMAAPSSPDGSTQTLRSPQDFVARNSTWCVWRPGFGVLAGRNDRRGTSGRDGVMAFAGVEGAVGVDSGDLLAVWDLVELFGQHPSPVRSNRWRSPARHRPRRSW